jgi:glycogen debranching enzyme
MRNENWRLKARFRNVAAILAGLGISWAGGAQGPPQTANPSSPAQAAGLNIERTAMVEMPFSVVGPQGAILGRQDGSYELWLFPWKILGGMKMSVSMQDYPVPINVNEQAAEIEVEPDRTTIVYSHPNFTIRQIMLAPKTLDAGDGAMVIYEMQAIRPMTVTFSFDPVMQRMWPTDSPPPPSPEWVSNSGGSGFYILHLAFPNQAAALAIPGSEPGIQPPYQERPSSWPLQFVLQFDPQQDANKAFPLLLAFANSTAAATKESLRQSLGDLESRTATIQEQNRAYYANFLAERTAIETPDANLNAAFSWAEIAIDQLRVQTAPGVKDEALTAGFLGSGDATRPGFGWFFGRDALWSLYAVNSYGDFATAKQEIEFLLRHQRADGKIMHERSQTADLVNWASLPYEYASADSTPLLAMAADDYLKISGDQGFIASIWPGLKRAWNLETTHDTDGDGIYDNSQGTGWVESWVPKMPQQEIYLAALDEQASIAFADLARTTGHSDLVAEAQQRAARIAKTIESEYYLPDAQGYAFSRNGSDGVDKTESIFPAVAWWDGTYGLEHADPMMGRWADSHISTDWGTRIISDGTSFYDPISYHQGTVWPLYTGWVSVAEYRAGHDLSGYAHLMQNANLTWAQDLGDVTELLSGRFFQAMGRSTAHQLWSSAMVISPVLRGMFGLEWNASGNALTISPHLPAAWNEAAIRRLPFGGKTVDLAFQREGRAMLVQASDPTIHLASRIPGAETKNGVLHIPLPGVEAGITPQPPEYGAETQQMKVIEERYSDHELTLRLSAPGGTTQRLSIRENAPAPKLFTQDGELGSAEGGIRTLQVRFPESDGYTGKTVTLRW